MEKSPDGLHLAVVDSQNRVRLVIISIHYPTLNFHLRIQVLVLDATTGVVVNTWKGYHHVQLGWLFVANKDPPEDIQGRYPAETKSTCLLVLYLPRRGAMEVISVERKVMRSLNSSPCMGENDLTLNSCRLEFIEFEFLVE